MRDSSHFGLDQPSFSIISNPHAEAVVAASLIHGHATPTGLCSGLFVDERYAAIVDLYAGFGHQAIAPADLVRHLGRQFGTAAATDLIKHLTVNCPTEKEVASAMVAIDDCWRRRQCVNFGALLVQQAEEIVMNANGQTSRAPSDKQLCDVLATFAEACSSLQHIIKPLPPLLSKRPGQICQAINLLLSEIEILAASHVDTAHHLARGGNDADAARYRARAEQLSASIGKGEA